LYHTQIPWTEVMWTFFQKWFWDPKDEYILAGDEVVCGKAGGCMSVLGRVIGRLPAFVKSAAHNRSSDWEQAFGAYATPTHP